jgi:hypothetical protein
VSAHDNLGPQFIHRGIALNLPEDVSRVVNDPDSPADVRANALTSHLEATRQGHLGQWWSDDSDDAAQYSAQSRRTPDGNTERVPWMNTSVLLHAEKPPRARPDRRDKYNRGVKLNVTSMEFGRHDHWGKPSARTSVDLPGGSRKFTT